ncbi:MAG: hypothetical protein EXS46_02040 [Candidatus Taylorbacteria bacterium]|nr:hypothetical protein [Candidatus Taylorbacteria bacterium]
MKNTQKSLITLLLVILVILSILGGVYFYSKKIQNALIPQAVGGDTQQVNNTYTTPSLSSLSVDQRNKILAESRQTNDNLETSNLSGLLDRLLSGENPRDIGPIISSKLQTDSEQKISPIYSKFASALHDPKIDRDIKISLIRVLGDTATTGALKIIIENLLTDTDSKLTAEYQQAISRSADMRWGDRFNEELSPILEAAYKNSVKSNNTNVWTLSSTLAGIGAPTGIALLLEDAIKKGEGPSNSARFALLKTRNPRAIAVLAKGLRDQEVGNLELIICAKTLAAMGSSIATKEIIDWAKGRDASYAPLVKSLLLKMRDTDSVDLVKKVIFNKEPFKSIEIKNAVNDVLEYVSTH